MFAPETGLVYLVPATGIPVRGCSLRLDPSRNGQSSGIRWAADHLIGPP